jgi:hypothetical protein
MDNKVFDIIDARWNHEDYHNIVNKLKHHNNRNLLYYFNAGVTSILQLHDHKSFVVTTQSNNFKFNRQKQTLWI